MKRTTMNINVTDCPPSHSRRRRRRLRLSQKGKNRLLFLLVLVVLFGLSCGITSLVVSRPGTVEEVAADLPETETVPVAAPKPVADPYLPTIVETKEETPEETLPEGEVAEEEDANTTVEDESADAPSEEEGETTLPSEGESESAEKTDETDTSAEEPSSDE